MKKKLLFTFFILLIYHFTFNIDNSFAQWTQINGIYGGNDVNCFASSGANLFSGTFGSGIFLSTNNGISWTAVNNGLTIQYITALAVSGSNLFAGTNIGGISLSTNMGSNWSAINNGLTGGLAITAIVNSGTNIFAASYDHGVFLTTNNGGNWISVNSGLSTQYIMSLAISGTNIFAGTNYNGVYLSTNNGANWTAVNNGLTNSSVKALAVSGTNLFAGTNGGGVFLTTNNGINWTQVNNELMNLDVWSFAVLGTNIIAGTSGGVYFSSNNGTNWVIKNQGFGTIPTVISLIISNNYVFSGNHFHTVWRRSSSEIVSIQNINKNVPFSYSLNQNYPNPFNPTTKIKFDIAKKEDRIQNSEVKLKIFDILGKEVATLVNESLYPGTYEVTFDANNYPGGVYFYRILIDGFSETKKMLLLK